MNKCKFQCKIKNIFRDFFHQMKFQINQSIHSSRKNAEINQYFVYHTLLDCKIINDCNLKETLNFN